MITKTPVMGHVINIRFPLYLNKISQVTTNAGRICFHELCNFTAQRACRPMYAVPLKLMSYRSKLAVPILAGVNVDRNSFRL